MIINCMHACVVFFTKKCRRLAIVVLVVHACVPLFICSTVVHVQLLETPYINVLNRFQNFLELLRILEKYKTSETPKIDNIYLSTFRLYFIHHQDKLLCFINKTPKTYQSSVVYEFTCPGYNSRYIGKTDRCLYTRTKENSFMHITQNHAYHTESPLSILANSFNILI